MAKELEPKVIVGLEVGTSKVVAVVGEVLPDGVVNVLGVGSCPSKGIDRGSITDLDAVVNSIQRAIEAAESMADCQIMSVTLAITGEHIQSLNESGFVAISENEVTQDEIDDALHTASSVKLPEGLSLLHIIPQEYAVDKQVNIKNPLGLQGVRLKANVHLIACHQDWQNNLKKAVERCGLQVDKVVFSGFAATHSVLTEGAGTMNMMVYTNGSLRFSKVIPYAGNIVTNDIAHACTVSRAEAERIKVNYASALYPARLHGDKKIEVASIGGRAPRALTKSDLSLITSARYIELLGVVKDELDKLKADLETKHIKFELIAGVVITGGGAQIEDLKDCASSVFGCQVRIGSPLNITGLTDYVNRPQYSTVVGLLQYHHQNSDNDPVDSNYGDEALGKKFWKGLKNIFNKVKSEF